MKLVEHEDDRLEDAESLFVTQFKCRRCGDLFGLGPSLTAAEWHHAANGFIAAKHITTHDCHGDCIGIADLVGAQPAENIDSPPQAMEVE